MSPALAVQTKKYGAITAFDLVHDRRLIASLIKEKANLVDYSHPAHLSKPGRGGRILRSGGYSTLEG